MSENQPEKDEHGCLVSKEKWNAEAEKCVPIEAVAKADLNLTQRIESVIKDVLDTKLAALEKAIDAKIETILKSKEIEMEQALRKGFGLDKDPPVHQSDLIAAIRKAQLEGADTGKRTPPPAGPQSTGPTGTSDLTPLEKAVKEFEEGTAK